MKADPFAALLGITHPVQQVKRVGPGKTKSEIHARLKESGSRGGKTVSADRDYMSVIGYRGGKGKAK